MCLALALKRVSDEMSIKCGYIVKPGEHKQVICRDVIMLVSVCHNRKQMEHMTDSDKQVCTRDHRVRGLGVTLASTILRTHFFHSLSVNKSCLLSRRGPLARNPFPPITFRLDPNGAGYM